MKICFSATGNSLSSAVDWRFGRCPWFVIVDEKGEIVEAIKNPAGDAFRGAGVLAAQTVVEKGAEAVVSGNIGPNAFLVLNQQGIKVYQGGGMTVKEAWEKYQKGELPEITTPQRGRCFGEQGK
ncbi:NifB/NifX family molybdenum-iron cluster-binding protein [bacterium]|nr:NifB/NifX family molybdenum-iron cluster-binding protein [bacterium]